MYTTENYLWGLLIYLLGFLILLPFGWHYTGKIPWRTCRDLTRLFFIVLALAPAKAYSDLNFLAPVWIVIAFEWLQPSTDAGAVRPLIPLALIFLIALGCYIGIRYLRRNRTTATPATKSGRLQKSAERASKSPDNHNIAPKNTAAENGTSETRGGDKDAPFRAYR